MEVWGSNPGPSMWRGQCCKPFDPSGSAVVLLLYFRQICSQSGIVVKRVVLLGYHAQLQIEDFWHKGVPTLQSCQNFQESIKFKKKVCWGGSMRICSLGSTNDAYLIVSTKISYFIAGTPTRFDQETVQTRIFQKR